MIIPIRCFSCGKVSARDWFKATYLCANAYHGLTGRRRPLGKIPQALGLRNAGWVLSPLVTLARKDNTDRSQSAAMDELGLSRYCCRRMLMTHVDLIEKLLRYLLRDLPHSRTLHTNTGQLQPCRARDYQEPMSGVVKDSAFYRADICIWRRYIDSEHGVGGTGKNHGALHLNQCERLRVDCA